VKELVLLLNVKQSFEF